MRRQISVQLDFTYRQTSLSTPRTHHTASVHCIDRLPSLRPGLTIQPVFTVQTDFPLYAQDLTIQPVFTVQTDFPLYAQDSPYSQYSLYRQTSLSTHRTHHTASVPCIDRLPSLRPGLTIQPVFTVQTSLSTPRTHHIASVHCIDRLRSLRPGHTIQPEFTV